MSYRLTSPAEDEDWGAWAVHVRRVELAEVRRGRLDRLEAGPTPTLRERADVAAVRAAVERGYVVLDGVESIAALVWERRCWVEDWPCVVVRPWGRWASVALDMEPAGTGLSGAQLAAVAGALARHRAIGGVSRVGVRTARLPGIRAERLAAELWAIAARRDCTPAPGRSRR